MLIQALVFLPLVSSVFGDSFATLNHLGNLSPYSKAPVPHGVSESLPADCTVEQVMLVRAFAFSFISFYNLFGQMGRHGSRFPLSSELPYITNLTLKLAGASIAIQKARLPDSLAFLKDGYTTSLGINNLTSPGRRQLFDHGVECVVFSSCTDASLTRLF